jgi:phage shock protein PspC (stress-responsive transcriptional regulator)
MEHAASARRLYRSRDDRKLAGVAGGLADYLSMDPTIVRVIWIVLGLTTGPVALVAYILFAMVVPKAPQGSVAI